MDKNREALIAFYRKALTVNTETTPAQVLAEVLADNFVSNRRRKQNQRPTYRSSWIFWKLIPDLKWGTSRYCL